MAKKANSTEPDRLETLETRLRQLEEAFSRVVLVNPPYSSIRSVRWIDFLSMGAEKKKVFSIFKEERKKMRETPVEPWKYLVQRRHPWRRQLYITGRNMTARQVVGSIQANKFNDEKAAANYKLPVEAIREAFAYVEQNKELLETEAEIERLMLKRGGVARGPQPLP